MTDDSKATTSDGTEKAYRVETPDGELIGYADTEDAAWRLSEVPRVVIHNGFYCIPPKDVA